MISMSWNSAGFVEQLLKKNIGNEGPLEIKTGPLSLLLVNRPEHIQALFRNSRSISNKPVTTWFMKCLLGASKNVIRFYNADDSGLAVKPRSESKVRPENRVYYFQLHTAHKYLAGQHLQALNLSFMKILDHRLDHIEIGEGWVCYPDFYQWLQSTVTRSSVEAVFGTKLLELHPNLIDDFWAFERSAPHLLRGVPGWMIPGAISVRKRLVESFSSWHAYAARHADCLSEAFDDQEWEPYFGSRLIRERQKALLKMEPMNSEARAREDLGLMFALNANILPCVFWYIIEASRRPRLLRQLLSHITAATSPSDGKIDFERLIAVPLLQSMVAEIFRLYVAIFTLRHSEVGPVSFSGYQLSVNQIAIVYNRPGALDEEAWNQNGRSSGIPLTQFDAGRFLVQDIIPNPEYENQGGGKRRESGGVNTSNKARFSMDGLASVWLPFGGGDRMCPGRHYAKMEILVTFALLFSKFEVKFNDEAVNQVRPNMQAAPFGSLPPTIKVPFYLLRKAR